MAQNPITQQRVLLTLPAEGDVRVQHDIPFSGAGGAALTMDIYHPARTHPASPWPVTVLVHGYADAGFHQMLGCRFKEMQSTVSWAKLIAASGVAAVTYTNEDPVADLHALVGWLRSNGVSFGIDGSRIGIWASSGHAALALSLLMRDGFDGCRCATLLYGYTLDAEGATQVADAAKTFHFVNGCAGRHVHDVRADVPLFLARAGHDQLPGLNQALDRFIADALSCNLPITMVNHSTGPHAFDLLDDTDTTRAIVEQTLMFLARHLGSAADVRDRWFSKR